MTLARHFFLTALLTVLLNAQADRFGLAACAAAGDGFADRTYFLLCHSSLGKVPVWAGYELKPEHLTRAVSGRQRFHPDARLLHSGAYNSGYTYSGYSRGHMAPAAGFAWSAEAIRATYLLSNVVPQVQSMNAGPWMRIENAVAPVGGYRRCRHCFHRPGLRPRNPGDRRRPHRGSKALLQGRTRGAIRTQNHVCRDRIKHRRAGAAPLNSFFVSVEEIERRTGLDLFSGLEDAEERLLESQQLPWPAARR